VLITTPYLSLPSPFLFFLTIEKGHPAAWMSFFYRESLRFVYRQFAFRHIGFKKAVLKLGIKIRSLSGLRPAGLQGS
jgi:hypothetical protein